jgi:hypothetical protein
MRALVIGMMLLTLGTTEAAAQAPRLVNGAWVMPTRHVHAQNEYYAGGYEAMIIEACQYYGCDPGYVITVMNCESGGNPYAEAYNPVSGNMTRGLFQIDDMWGVSTNPADQIWFAAEHLTAGDIWWACG